MVSKMFDIRTATPALSSVSQAFSVTEINAMIADLLESGLPSFLWIEGEISNLSVAASGHRYLSLKDAGSTISCALFRGNTNRISKPILDGLKNGDKVIIKANLSVYKPRGSYQLIISDIEPAGFGALAKAFTELKSKLEMAGFTASARKRAIPSWARGIAVITSETGAAIRDVLTTINRRAPFIPVNIYPTLVQGSHAPQQIVSAIQSANDDTQVEVIILVRGGGSLEDLMAFNDESVAMAVVNSRLPIVTGIGHETDFTIVDFVSDYRAATPTAAAEIVSPDKKALATSLNKQFMRLIRAATARSDGLQKQLNVISKRMQVQHPYRQLQQQSQRLDELTHRLQHGIIGKSKQQKQVLDNYHQRLQAKNPMRKLINERDRLSVIARHLCQLINQRIHRENQTLQANKVWLLGFKKQFQSYQQHLKGLNARLQLLSPLGVLERGYTLSFDGNKQLIRSVKTINVGDEVNIRFNDGEAKAIIRKKR